MRRFLLAAFAATVVLGAVSTSSAYHDKQNCIPKTMNSVPLQVCYRDRSTTWFPSGEPVRHVFLDVHNRGGNVDVDVIVACTNRNTGKGELTAEYYVQAPPSYYFFGGIPPVANKNLHCPMDP